MAFLRRTYVFARTAVFRGLCSIKPGVQRRQSRRPSCFGSWRKCGSLKICNHTIVSNCLLLSSPSRDQRERTNIHGCSTSGVRASLRYTRPTRSRSAESGPIPHGAVGWSLTITISL